MAVIQDYSDMSIDMFRETDDPDIVVGMALAITMKQEPDAEIPHVSEKLCKKLILAEHMSVFEHVSYSFLIEGISRSLLAQITRQRTAKPTSGSQHYQKYSDYPMAINEVFTNPMEKALNASLRSYNECLLRGVPKEEARQVLPNACVVNYLWTIDARNLYYFLRQRLCNRNVREMRVFASKILSLVTPHFPALFLNAGPQCKLGPCHQKLLNMQCLEKKWILL